MNMHHTAAALARPSPSVAGWKIPVAAWMVTAVFILSNSATPLYLHWQRQFAFSSGTLTVIFAAYIIGLLGALLVAGQLSDRLGRKAVLLPGFLIAMAACGLFVAASSVAALIAARFLTGIAVGIIVSAGMAAVVDVGGPARKRQASQAASIAMVLGAGLGPLLAGTLAQQMDHPVATIFGIELALLASAMVVMLTMPLPVPPRGGPGSDGDDGNATSWRLRLPSVPAQNRRDLALGVAVFAPGLSATSFVLALGPALLSKLLHITSPLLAGGTACLMFLSATGVQFAVKKLPIRTILLLGATATALSMAALIGAIHAAIPALLLAAASLAGMGQGLGQLGGLTAIGMRVADHRRAQANSLLNIGAYIPAGLLPVATGFLMDRAGMTLGATTFAAALIVAAAAAACLVATRLPR
ncbi:MFS transporter [Duganella aceris]|uniref:MFS transporter n=1 Tax=Duganella aceris TaxID=2703883 RepID=A0ABX0FH84_9BURK|nr:MFS transporter [Duganella aceris]NGZ83880.1 MFS transporter [Duganella aceris]